MATKQITGVDADGNQVTFTVTDDPAEDASLDSILSQLQSALDVSGATVTVTDDGAFNVTIDAESVGLAQDSSVQSVLSELQGTVSRKLQATDQNGTLQDVEVVADGSGGYDLKTDTDSAGGGGSTVGSADDSGSGSISTADSSETVFAANADRQTIFFQNLSSTTMFISFGGAATKGAGSIKVAPGGGYDGPAYTDELQVICATQGAEYTAIQS